MEILEALDTIPAADVQPTKKENEYRSLLEECERKFRYLLECEIESSSESIEVKKSSKKYNLAAKIIMGGGGKQNEDS